MISGTGVPFHFLHHLGSFLDALRVTACLTSKHETALRCSVGFDIKLPEHPNRVCPAWSCRPQTLAARPKLPQKKIAKPASSLVRRIS